MKNIGLILDWDNNRYIWRKLDDRADDVVSDHYGIDRIHWKTSRIRTDQLFQILYSLAVDED